MVPQDAYEAVYGVIHITVELLKRIACIPGVHQTAQLCSSIHVSAIHGNSGLGILEELHILAS